MKTVALLVSRASHPGGLEKYARLTASAFAKRNCHVTVLTLGPPLRMGYDNIDCVSLGSPRPLSVVNLWKYDEAVRRYLREHPFDIVFGFDRTRRQTHLRAGNGVHAAYLQHRSLTDPWHKKLSLRLNPLHHSLLHFERTAFECPELHVLFTNSHMVRHEILSLYRTDPSKVEVIHNGVEWQSWQNAFETWPEARSTFLREHHLPESAFYFLFVGHGYRRKGLAFLLQGLAQTTGRDVRLLVVGKDQEQSLFESLAEGLDLGQRVHFFGQRTDIVRFYQTADALAVPSIYDPFANVTVEALAMGLFTVSSAYNGGREVLTSHTGRVIEALDQPDAMAAALLAAMARRKTKERAAQIRKSVQHLDISRQLNLLVDKTLQSIEE